MWVAANDWTPGLTIHAPRRERRWLKTPLTVISIRQGDVDARGPWLHVLCSFVSPDEGKVHHELYRYRPQTFIQVLT